MRCGVMVLVLAVVGAGGLGGCKSSESPIFFTSLSSPYPDVPVPASFTLVSQGNNILDPGAGGRFTEHLYQSTDGAQPIVVFFRKQLPRQGWVAQGESENSGRVLLRFIKGGEVLEIEVWNGAMIRTNVRLRISRGTEEGGGGSGG